MLRELVSRFSSTIAERRASVRKRFDLPVRVCFAPEKSMVRSAGPCDEGFLSGETKDISETGIGFIVSSIRINEKYLVGQERKLNVELDIAGRKIRMQVMGVRYERVETIHLSTERYLIGAQIVEINEEDKEAFDELLRQGLKADRSAPSMIEVGIK
jgi:hypothetical protein